MPAHLPPTKRRHSGFTLVELAITVAVLAIVLAIGLPSLRDVVANNRLSGATNEILALTQFAKIEAIKRNVTVDVCAGTVLAGCTGADWRRIVVVANTPQGAIVVREYLAPNRLTVRANATITTSTDSRIRFRPEGFAWRGSTTTQGRIVNGRIQVCTPAPGPAMNARNIVVSGARASVDAPLPGGATCAATLP